MKSIFAHVGQLALQRGLAETAKASGLKQPCGLLSTPGRPTHGAKPGRSGVRTAHSAPVVRAWEHGYGAAGDESGLAQPGARHHGEAHGDVAHLSGMSDMVAVHQNAAATWEADPTGVWWRPIEGRRRGGRRWP
jgi:hypothetical protein